MTITPTTTFGADFLAAQNRELSARRQSYVADLDRLSAAAQDLVDGRGATEMADEDGFGEVDTVNVEREQLLVVAGEVRARIDEIDLAMERMAAGSYGICDDCHRPIAEARLEAMPEAQRCVGCKSAGILRRR
ncbi:MAG: DnaK suppressor protein [Acidimicrobiaceae bacterium]|jgi:DnaK suppressor protein